jgi:hypothetical protein
MQESAIVFGNSKGVVFQWGNVEFTLELSKCNELIDLAEVLQSSGFEDDDDLVTDLWVGKKLLRWGGIRVPIDLKTFYPNLLNAVRRHQDHLDDVEHLKNAESALKEITDGLGLDK